MWMPRSLPEKRVGGNGLIAVAIDKDKSSQIALKWAIDNLLVKGQTVILIHVNLKSSLSSHSSSPKKNQFVGSKDPDSKDLFLPFRCFCTRKDISCKDVTLEDTDVAKALIEYVTQTLIETLIVGGSTKGGFLRSPFTRRGLNGKSYGELSVPDSDISFVSSGRASIDSIFPAFYDNTETSRTPPRLSNMSDFDSNYSFESLHYGRRSMDQGGFSPELSPFSHESDQLPSAAEDVEAEMRRLKLELKQTMEMYSSACKEALTAKQKKGKKPNPKQQLRLQKQLSELLSWNHKKPINAEMKAHREAEEKRKALDALANSDVRYRRYPIEEIEAATDYFSESRKIGEGGYGPVYKGYLDHTSVAIKVLRPDAAQGRSQFQQEVEVLCCIRHPNMVLLLGACPEYGCLVYEFMANGSLEDRLFCRGNTPPLSWQLRFRIAAEIGTGLLFLHQTKPEPLVHRDLKPANILLDRNFVSKISDVGLARLVPPSVADNVTQYRMTSTAGTFCYIDPEYQQTGMLGIKSDIYSLGIMFLQILTAKPAMGLTHHVERALEKGTFAQMLDPAVPDWPIEEATYFAKLSLKCAELRRKDRPDLGKVVLPELKRLRAIAEETTHRSLSTPSASDLPSSRSEVSSRSSSAHA
ncbi:hypothetical protein H0E87_028992 [Populus deltoides]|uniref:RING-type E3 ubiquitin transferase n=1 Tax=Populus deltoides TaxID=3696 RepID=A0A8T2WLA0_POPDE|nr:hypothetical protein H0E87_028992 [Populus deltoides]